MLASYHYTCYKISEQAVGRVLYSDNNACGAALITEQKFTIIVEVTTNLKDGK